MHLKPYSGILFRSPVHSLEQLSQENEPVSAIFEESIYLSSRSSWNAMKHPEMPNGHSLKLKDTLQKYWLRSCARCTPLHTFAGTGIATITDKPTEICLGEVKEHIRAVSLNITFYNRLVRKILSNREIAAQIRFYPNNSIYSAGEELRFVESVETGDRIEYQLSTSPKTAHLLLTLQEARDGKTLDDLSALLTNDHISKADALSYLENLLQSDLLQPEINIPVTGCDPMTFLITKLKPIHEAAEIVKQLENIAALLAAGTFSVAHYNKIEQLASGMLSQNDIDKNLLRVNLFLQANEAIVNRQVIQQILDQVAVLHNLSRDRINRDLDFFKEQYLKKFEQEEQLLAHVLDTDFGIGYKEKQDAGEDIDTLITGEAFTGSKEDVLTMDYLQRFALSKYEDWQKEKTSVIKILDEELQMFKTEVRDRKFQPGQFLMGSLMHDEEHSFTFHLMGTGGPSAANIFARLSGHNEHFRRFIDEITTKEEMMQGADVILAEVVHLPGEDSGNLCLRPVLRKYEIPYMSESGVAEASRIPVSDLWVKVYQDEIILTSRKFNKRVIPVMTATHNYAGLSCLPLYKFLCDLQHQGFSQPCLWDWGVLTGMAYLPRVTYKNIILSKATWKINTEHFKKRLSGSASPDLLVQTFKMQYQLPDRVLHQEQDGELLLDLKGQQGRNRLINLIRTKAILVFKEFLFTKQNSIVNDASGAGFANEIVIPYYTAETAPEVRNSKFLFEGFTEGVQRIFVPGDEWLSFKIYCGENIADSLLTEKLLPFLQLAKEEGCFEKFFFIRYKDDFSHLRLRFYNSDISLQSMLQVRFMEILRSCMDTGMISNIVIATYKRELERYGAYVIEETESLFYNDSFLVLQLIELSAESDKDQYRMLFAMRGIDALLNDFGFDIQEKIRLLHSLRSGFFMESGGGAILKRQLDDRYRRHKRDIFAYMSDKPDNDAEMEEAIALLAQRSVKNAPIARSIKLKLEQHKHTDKLPNLLGSYLHMFMNRLFIADQRKQELLIYHFQEKYYNSCIAINKKAISQ